MDKKNGFVTVQAGTRVWQLNEELERQGLALPSLGSIDEQSIAGAIATGTHGSSLYHGLMSDGIVALHITLGNGKTVSCSKTRHPELFRAALVSLGALGIVVEITIKVVPSFTLEWTQVIDDDMKMLRAWDKDLWTQAEFVRVWWFPYTRRAVVWSAEKTDKPLKDPALSWYGGVLGYYVYRNLLYLSQYIPSILPWAEWFVFGMQYGFRNGTTTTAVQPSRKALLMDCLYSQTVNEWALPLSKGPEAILRLNTWVSDLAPSHPDYLDARIPFDNRNIYIHAPLEVRVADTTRRDNDTLKPLLDPTCDTEATLYLNATLYRPYGADPLCRERYYEAFEWLMKDLGGRPHWAKNFGIGGPEIEGMYGKQLEQWRDVRNEVDPEGLFVGEWHREIVLGRGERLACEEWERGRRPAREGGMVIDGVVGRGQ